MKPLAPLRAVGDDLALAQSLADAAAEMATRYFRRTGLEVRHKPDGSPVTEADRNIERLLRMRLALARPNDVVVGEEFDTTGTGARRWFIDPVDGTKGFVAGRPGWRTLLAVEIDGVVTTGVVSAPALRMRWYARRGRGAWIRVDGVGNEEPRVLALHVAPTAQLDHMEMAVWPPKRGHQETLHELACTASTSAPRDPRDRTAATPLGTAPHGALLVAAGQLDAFVQIGGGPWDRAAFVPIVEEAGGRFGDLAGGTALDAPAVLYSNGILHDRILEHVRQGAGL